MGTYRAKYSFKQIPIHIFFGFLIALTFVAIGATKFRDPIELLLIFISFGAFFTIVLIFYQYIGNVFTKLKINSEYIEAYDESQNKRIKVAWNSLVSAKYEDSFIERYLYLSTNDPKQKLKVAMPLSKKDDLITEIAQINGEKHFLIKELKKIT